MVSHPVFGLHTASSGHTEFGGLGSLGTPIALAAHPQLTTFPGKQVYMFKTVFHFFKKMLENAATNVPSAYRGAWSLYFAY